VFFVGLWQIGLFSLFFSILIFFVGFWEMETKKSDFYQFKVKNESLISPQMQSAHRATFPSTV
jgi:hypothetical protein